MAAASNTVPSDTTHVKIFDVRLSTKPHQKYSILRFNSSVSDDLKEAEKVTIQRENNVNQFKSAFELVSRPQFGAGSEYKKIEREEARRKKYGFMSRQYNPSNQPWLLNVYRRKHKSSKKKETPPSSETPRVKRFKGTRDGGVSDNASYFVFEQTRDGGFEVHPAREWYTLTPQVNYKYFSAEEAEVEFERRHKSLNKFNIMMKHRMNMINESAANNDVTQDDAEGSIAKKRRSGLTLTDVDDGVMSSDDEEDVEETGGGDSDDEKNSKNRKTADNMRKRKVQKSKPTQDGDDVSDDSVQDDHEGDEKDYTTSSSSEEEQLSGDEREKIYTLKGVDEEADLRKLLDENASEDEAEKEASENEGEQSEGSAEVKGSNVSTSSSSSSSSNSTVDSDSEIDKTDFKTIATRKSKVKKKQHSSAVATSSASTVSKPVADEKPISRKRPPSMPSTAAASSSGGSTAVKRHKLDVVCDEISVETVSRYLSRKPVSIQELVRKFKHKINRSMNTMQISNKILDVLKEIRVDKKMVNNVMQLSLRK